MHIDWTVTILTALIIFFATISTGITGFGQAIIALGLLPFIRDPGSSTNIITIVSIFSSAQMFWSLRSHFRVKPWAIAVIGLIFGLPLGVALYDYLNPDQLRTAIAITILISIALIFPVNQLSSVQAWIRKSGYRPGWPIGVLAGFLGGFLGGAVAIPGPPMIIYGAFMIAAGFWTGSEMKAIFAGFFGTVMLYRAAALAISGEVTVALLSESAIVLPGIFIGVWIGLKVYNYIPRKMFGIIILALLAVNAIILLLKQ